MGGVSRINEERVDGWMGAYHLSAGEMTESWVTESWDSGSVGEGDSRANPPSLCELWRTRCAKIAKGRDSGSAGELTTDYTDGHGSYFAKAS